MKDFVSLCMYNKGEYNSKDCHKQLQIFRFCYQASYILIIQSDKEEEIFFTMVNLQNIPYVKIILQLNCSSILYRNAVRYRIQNH